ncbi:MAG: hypothetical protein M1832_001658 [Thelocarpon impressellum]|nr:MAG: hypothetical protein M1832_001658 [Thelocarpon impressellum]
MTLAKGSEEAGILLHKASTVDIFDLFDAKGHRTNQLVVEALGIIRAFVQTCQGPRQPLSVPGASEDSQDYGDWSAFEDPGDAALSQITCEHFMSVAHEGLARLVSNAFGADARPDDSLLIEITDTWIAVAALLVQQGMKHWDNFLGTHSRDSWTSLRETEQARQYSVYFLARVLQNDRQSYEQQKPAFLHTWISSLLQRQSMLKYENELTCALIRVDGGNPLLRNLPFWTKAGTSAVQITRTEFSDSRLSLISSVLANMRESLEEAEVSSGGNAGHMRRDYAQLLKSMMSSMKKNYQELAQGPPRNDEYVQFVQKVVDFLQQHTIHICPIDRFFTDSSAFPLPATDPSYVVGRLRHYGLRLSDSRVHKQLVSFVLSVSERAAVDQQQAYLVSQLRTAMSGDFEAGHRNRPTLRAFLMEAVFPAYMELALHTSSSWILARPVLQAAASGAEDLLQDIDGTDWASLQSAGAMITSLLAAMVQGVLGRSTSEDHASQLSVKRLYYVTATSTLPLLDYIHRISGGFRQAVEQVSWLKKWAQSNVEGDVRAEDAIIREERSEKSEEAYEEIRRFNMSELRQTLKQNWAQHSGTNYVIRGSMRKEVKVPLGELEEERAKLKEAVLEFLDVLRRMSGVREHVEVEGEELRVRMPPRESDVPEWMW